MIFCPLHEGGETSGFGLFINPSVDKVNALYPSVSLLSYSIVSYIVGHERLLATSFDPATGLLTVERFDYECEAYFRHNPHKETTLGKVIVRDYRNIRAFYSPADVKNILCKIGLDLQSALPKDSIIGFQHGGEFLLMIPGEKGAIYQTLDDIRLKIMAHQSDIDLHLLFALYRRIPATDSLAGIGNKLDLTLNAYQGKEGVISYDPTLLRKEEYEEFLIRSFPSALANGEFKLCVQGKYDMDGRFFYGGEVLSRWEKDGELLQPTVFIPVFEKNGLIAKFDRYVLTNTLEKIRQWLKEGRVVVPLSVNISRGDFSDPMLFNSILSLIDFYEVPHRLVELEITE